MLRPSQQRWDRLNRARKFQRALQYLSINLEQQLIWRCRQQVRVTGIYSLNCKPDRAPMDVPARVVSREGREPCEPLCGH